MSLAPELRYESQAPVPVPANGGIVQLLGPVNQAAEVMELAVQVTGPSGGALGVTVLLGEYVNSPQWEISPNGGFSDPGFLLAANTPVNLGITVLVPGTYFINWQVRLRVQECGPRLDPANRRTVFFLTSNPPRAASINYSIDGGGAPPSLGVKGQVTIPANCTLTGWVLTLDQADTVDVGILKSTYAAFPVTASITGGNDPQTAAAQKAENLGPLVGWTTVLLAGDQLQFDLTAVTVATRINLALLVTIP